ncbi:MAG: hypothetical protein V5A74_07710, partial [Desulfohalobiaceae bacterium]
MNLDFEKFKPFGWGIVVGAILILIIMFSTGWAVMSTAAKKQAEEQAEKAVDKELAEICVYQFKQANNTQKKLQKMSEMEYNWDRADYIKKNNWATMPSDDSTSSGVADNCA